MAQDNASTFSVKHLNNRTLAAASLFKDARRRFESPFVRFRLMHQRRLRKLVFIAARDGLGRMLSILRFLKETNDSRPAVLLYAAPSQEDVELRRELDQMPRHIKIVQLSQSPDADEGACFDAGTIRNYCRDVLSEAHFFLCGPIPMMQKVRSILLNLGLKEKRICSECSTRKTKASYAQ